MKKRYKVLISIIIVLVAIPLFDFFILRDSVMEDIYRNVYWGDLSRINRMEGIHRLDDEAIDGLLWMSNETSIWTFFEEENLKDGFEVYVTIPTKKERRNTPITFQGVYYLSENEIIHIGIKYNHKTRSITYTPIYIFEENTEGEFGYLTNEKDINECLDKYGITEADIREYQHYILYDVVYQSWISGTRNGRKLNVLDYWNIKEIDNTFSFEENVSDEETM